MYSLIDRLNLIRIPIEMYIFLAGALLVVGLFILISHMRSQKLQALILIILGLSFSVAAYLVQNYMCIWFPELFIPGGPYGTWYVFRNDLSAGLRYIAVLIGVLIPAGFLLPRMNLISRWRYPLLFSTLIATATLYYAYIFSVTITPGSSISIPGWLPATSPFFASVAIATALLGYFLLLSEFFDQIASWPFRVIFVASVTALAIFLTYQTAVAVYAVIAWLLITKCMNKITPVVLAACMSVLGIACEFVGSFFAAMGADVGRFIPIWVFPLLFMTLMTLAPAPYFLTKINSKLHNFVIFGVTWGTGILVAIASVILSAGVYMQPDLLPQTPLSIATNVVPGIAVAAVLYYILSVKLHTAN
ncbi:MAG: hypothetical protein U9N40_00240 [Euryarchaeota archaeon]|nr:hypothetical protein [Euryarchaeota archaeon]